MMNLDYSFEQSPWELFLQSKREGDILSAENVLALLEGEDSETVEDAFRMIEARMLTLDISGLEQISIESKAGERLRREVHLVQTGFCAEDFEQDDPLRIYLKELETVPKTSNEQRLASTMTEGNNDSGTELVNSGLHRVVEISGEYVGHGVLLMDLIQEGNLGLWQAIQEYRDGDYCAFRDRKVRNAMGKAVLMQARSHGVGEKMRSRMQHFQETDGNLLTELGRNPTVAEIAERMNISPEEAESVRRMMADTMMMKKQEQPKEEPREQDTDVEDTAYYQMRERVSDLLAQLSKEDADILSMRFGLDKSAPMPPENVAAKLGLSVQEVLEREKNALGLLRNG